MVLYNLHLPSEILFLFIFGILGTLQICCWFLLTHLSYYILAHRIQLLRKYLSDYDTRRSSVLSEIGSVSYDEYCNFFFQLLRYYVLNGKLYRQRHSISYKLKTVHKVLNLLCRSADELNSFNSVPIFLIFTGNTINLIMIHYLIIYNFLNGSNDELVRNYIFVAGFEISIIAIILNAADSPVYEVRSVSFIHYLI